jgi:glycosyltransferase involved in cell wall biosynthesis
MRVAMISEHASLLACLGGVDSGGQNVYVRQLARHLARRGWVVDVFTRRDDPSLPDAVEWCPGARVVNVPAGPPERVRKEDLLPYMGAFTASVLRHARRRRYDLVHANFFLSALVAADVRRRTGVPFAITFHALGKVRRRHQGDADAFPPERLAIEERVVREADAIIAECPQDEDDLVTLYGADPAKLRTIPCGFYPAEFGPMDRAAARRAVGVTGDEPVVLQLGRMVPRKGVDNVIRGVARLRQVHGIAARLLVVGGESRDPDPVKTPEIGRLMRVAAEERIADAVTFAGSRGRKELRAYYAAADVFVTTPWYEPFGITPVEAMACGTPVVGAAVGGIKATIRDGETGFLVPPKDPDALAGKLAALLGDAALRAAMGRAALRRANTHYTWAKVAELVAGVYRELVPAAVGGATPAAIPVPRLAFGMGS